MDLLGTSRATLRAGSFAAWTATALLGLRVLRRLDPAYDTWPVRRRYVQRWTRGVVPILGVELTVTGSPPHGGTFLVVANHRSPLDILVSLHLLGGVCLSHEGVADLPMIGAAARINETIFVDRDDRRSGARAVRQMRHRLQQGRNVIAFPEGTTFTGDEVRPFQAGAFLAARGLDVRVLPLGLAYEPGAEYVDDTFNDHLMRMTARPRTPVWVSIGQPLPVPRRGDEETVRQVVQHLVDQAARSRDRGSRAAARS